MCRDSQLVQIRTEHPDWFYNIEKNPGHDIREEFYDRIMDQVNKKTPHEQCLMTGEDDGLCATHLKQLANEMKERCCYNIRIEFQEGIDQQQADEFVELFISDLKSHPDIKASKIQARWVNGREYNKNET